MTGITGGSTGGNTFNIYDLGALEGVYDVNGNQVTANTPFDSLSKSEQEKLIINLLAGSPILLGPGPTSNEPGDAAKIAFAMDIESKKNDAISAMLDAWNKSIQDQIAASKESQKHEQIVNDQINYHTKQHDTVQGYIDWVNARSIELQVHVRDAGSFQDYLRSLPINERIQEIRTSSNLITDNYYRRDGVSSPEDVNLASNVLSASLMQALVVMPLAQQLLIQPINPSQLSNQINLNVISDQTTAAAAATEVNPVLQSVLPVINFFVLDMIKDTSIMLYLRQRENGDKPPTIDFANEYAALVLAKVADPIALAHIIQTRVPGAANFNAEQLADAVLYARLFALANAINLFIHVEGGKLGENELKDLLIKLRNGETLPTNDKRGELLAAMNTILADIDPNRRIDVVENLLRYVSSMPDPSDQLDMWQALSASAEEVTTSFRAVNQPLTT